MISRPWRLAPLAIFAALSSPSFAADTYDPDVAYFTIETPHFLVMYPEGYDHIAIRAGQIAEDKLPFLVRRYKWQPAGRISLIINDQTDFANGFATILPSKTITVFVTAPTEVSGLEDYDDWLDTVVTHELTHIIHLDMAYGLPWVGRLIFGKYVSMNQYTPAWVTEGLAVYEETVSSGAGRGRNSYVDMVIRVAALEDKFPHFDQGYRGYPNWPFSNIAYFLGGRFQLWLAEHYGEDALLHYHRAYASDPIPYFSYLPADLAFGESLESLWIAFEAEMKEDALLALNVVKTSTLGITEPTRLTRYGGDLVGPRITPDGKHIIFSTSSPVDGARMRRIAMDGTDDTVLADDTFSKAIAFTPDGKAFYFQQTEINQRFYTHNSLLRYELASEKLARVEIDPDEAEGFLAPSGSIRGRDPDISPDGKRIVFVQTPYGSNRLVLAWLESNGVTIHPKEIVKAEPDVELSDPRFSPDGKLIAVSRFKGGRRDVILYDERGDVVLEVTRDRALDIEPTWSADGRWLVFASDRSGIYNLYAYDMQRGELRQLTNLVSGAYQPCVSRDGTTIVYRGYSAEGFDVYRMPFEPLRGIVVPLVRQPPAAIDDAPRRWPPRDPRLPVLPAPAQYMGPRPESHEPVATAPVKFPEGWEVHDYTALDTILPFHDNWNLFPALRANENEVYGSLTHFGSDAMGTQNYILSLTYGTQTEFVGGGVAYTNDQLEPTFGALALASAVTHSGAVIVRKGELPCVYDELMDRQGNSYCYGTPNGEYNERRLAALFSIGLPVLQRHLFSMSYVFEHRDALDDLPQGTLFGQLPRSGNFARVSLGYSYSNVRAFAHSISLERGQSFALALSALSRGLGGDYEEAVLTTEARKYVSMPWKHPWFRNHVLAGRLGLGISGGPDLAELFRVGGVAGSSALTTTTENFYGLRGFRTGVLVGTGVISGSLEYRAPIFRVDRGLNVPGFFGPLTLDVLHLALFADFGRVFEKVDLHVFENDFFGGFALGVGAELRADIAFFNLPLTVIFGVPFPVVIPENVDPDRVKSGSFYFQLGSTF